MTEPLKDRYAEALTRRRPDRAGCPSPDELQQLTERTLPEAERLRLFDHVAACTECNHEYALMDSVEASRPRRAPSRLFALAATLLLALSAGLIWRAFSPEPVANLVRGEEFTLELVAPDSGSVAPGPLFVWRRGTAGATYRFEILREGGVPSYSVLTTDTTLVLPDTVRLLPGADYTWWVQIVELGKTQTASAFRRLRIEPR